MPIVPGSNTNQRGGRIGLREGFWLIGLFSRSHSAPFAPEYGYDPVPFFAICLYGLTGIARLLFIGYEGFGGEYFQNSPQPITGCLTVLGITAGYHTVGFCRVESFAKCCLQRAEGGKSLGRQMVAEAGACVGSCSRAASISRSIACMSKLPDG